MREYLRKLFQAHYREIPAASIEPPDLPRRELAFMFWDKKGMIRHKGFLAVDEYKQFLVKNAPMNVYYSSTLYHSPWKDKMDEKGYVGCDLIFDIDCDHIPTPCKQDHDTWTCKGCGKTGSGTHPLTCPSCSQASFDDRTWLCDACLQKSKTETVKLADAFLVDDLGIEPRHLDIYFSGHRGYHVHVESSAFRGLSSDERRELADFITGIGISWNHLGFLVRTNETVGFTMQDPGWRGKVASKLLDIIDHVKDAPPLGLDKDIITTLVQNKDEISQRIRGAQRNWSFKGMGPRTWDRLLAWIVHDLRCEIDVPVTIDVHRLIRAPGSLHGKTGFVTCKLSRDELDAFDPFANPVVFKGGSEQVKMIHDVPRFRIGDVTYGPFAKDEVAELSHGAAVFLFCKGKGVVA